MLYVFILAGGFGTRLSSIVNDVPKPMASINGTPFLDYVIKNIQKSIPKSTIYILTHYKSDVIEQHFSDMPNIKIIREQTPLGTGGAIKNALNSLGINHNNSVLVLNGDTYIACDYQDFINNSINKINILIRFKENCARYSTMTIEDNLVIKFNKPGSIKKSSYINTGSYYFNQTDIITNFKKNIFMIEELFNIAYRENQISSYLSDGYFIDIGTPEDYATFCEDMKNEKR